MPHGARLRMIGSVNAPDTFELIIELDGFEADCEVVRRSGNEIAVRFLSSPRLLTPKRRQSVDPLVPASYASAEKKAQTGNCVIGPRFAPAVKNLHKVRRYFT